MRTRLRLGVVAGAAFSATLGIVQPAGAGELLQVDPAADVRFYDLSGDSESAAAVTEVPEHREGDLTSMGVRYGEKRVRIVLKFLDLGKSEAVLMLQGRLRFPSGGQLNYTEAVVTTTRDDRAGTAQLTTEADCSVRHRIRYAKNRARISFPAQCLDNPKWIQVNAWIITTDNQREPTYFFGDDLFPVLDPDDDEVERFTRRIRRP